MFLAQELQALWSVKPNTHFIFISNMVQLLQVYDFFHISKYGTKLTIIIATIKYTKEEFFSLTELTYIHRVLWPCSFGSRFHSHSGTIQVCWYTPQGTDTTPSPRTHWCPAHRTSPPTRAYTHSQSHCHSTGNDGYSHMTCCNQVPSDQRRILSKKLFQSLLRTFFRGSKET